MDSTTSRVSMARSRFTSDLDGLAPADAFAALGNDIRVEIIRVLWRANAAYAFDDGSHAVETMAYSRLQEAVEVADNGKFNYHLSQLEPHFIRRTEEGYRLSGAGQRIARTVIAVSGPDRVDFSEELDMACPLCGAPVAATYEDQWFRIKCTGCPGLFGDQTPRGTLFLASFPAGGLAARSPTNALDAGLYRCALDVMYLMYGVCRECAGPVGSAVSVCEDHTGGSCESCGTPFPVWAEMRCETCGFAKRLPIEMFVAGLVLASGVADDEQADLDGLSFERSFEFLQSRVETAVSRDPLAVAITIETGGGPVTVTVDEEMHVCEVDRAGRDDVRPNSSGASG